MNRFLLCCLAMGMLLASLSGQTLLPETSSNFVNFNLNRINMVRSYLPQYNGKGLTASIKEFQYDTLDIDFTGRHIPHARSTHEVSRHATLMATILGGGGNSFRNGQGVAWAGQLTSSSFLNIFPDDNSYFQQLGISVQNHSYGIDTIENFYGPIASAYDLQISQMPHLMHVFSIGNLGKQTPKSGPYAGIAGYANMTGEFKLAKNVLTLGVVDSFGLIDPFSSHGPAFDGRIKPELVAFGIDGSSAAAALASGSVMLLQQAYQEMEGELPPTALVKTLLINGANDLGPVGIDYVYGFGNLDTYQSLKTLLAGRYFTDTLQFDQSIKQFIEVPEGVRELKISLGWSDPPAPVHAEKALVNDLDLELIRFSDRRRWLPQSLSFFPLSDSLSREAKPGKDHVNNLEQIVLQDPQAGVYDIWVNAYDFGVAEQVFHVVYEWDTLSTFRWLFPTKNNQIVPSDLFYEQLYWETKGDITNGALSISFDGAHWQPIDDEVDLKLGTLQWFPPDTVSRALLRMQIGTEYFVSDTFTIAAQPYLRFVLNCPDSIGLSWTKQTGIDRYQLYQLEAEYMQPFLVTDDTFVVIQKKDLSKPFIAIAPVLENGMAGVRSFAYGLNQQVPNCYDQSFSGEVLGVEGHLYLKLSTIYGVTELILERQIGGQFSERQRISTVNGTNFEFIDTDLLRGSNPYRVKIRLQNGGFIYTSVFELEYIEPDRFLLFPNPVSRQGSFQVLYNVEQAEDVSFQLYTALGAHVLSISLIDLDIAFFADDLQSGMYFYRFVRDGQLLQGGKLVVR